jgi:eukaryotic-like serine/threonine-protein kinase
MPEWQVPGYAELKRIGSGGFGEVMLARHDATGTLVAVKYLRAELLDDQEFLEMFRGEAAVLAAMDDPNVVRLYEYVESPSGAAIVMELVAGVSLREILKYQGKTTAQAALVVLHGSLLGLAAAHRRGVVHRDYKPENVLVTGDGISKLTDFGIAARAGDRPATAGTLAYAAPEQMAGGQASPASDIYAATATFYECLTGRPPFTGDTAELLLRQHRSAPVPLDPLPEELRPLVAAGMAKDAAERPTDAASFVTQLSTAAAGGYGRDWQEHGRSQLGEAALLLALLWPSGPPPTVAGTTVQQVQLSQPGVRRARLRRPRLRHMSPVKAAIAAGVGIAVVAAGTALAANGLQRPAASASPAAAVRSVSLQASTLASSSPSTLPSPSLPVIGGSLSPGSPPVVPTSGSPTVVRTSSSPAVVRTSRSPVVITSSAPDTVTSTNSGLPAPVTPPGTPGGVAAVASGQYEIQVSWSDASAGITGFNVDNGCPVGSCDPGATLVQTTGPVDSTTFQVTPGTYQCFRVRAIDSAGDSPWSGYGCTSTAGFSVPATVQWTSTGVTVPAGDELGITASGTVTIGTGAFGPGGDPECTPKATFPLGTDANCYSLIARIGNGAPFPVGTSVLTTPGAGVLYLGIHDDSFSGNAGSWTARIKLGGLPPA